MLCLWYPIDLRLVCYCATWNMSVHQLRRAHSKAQSAPATTRAALPLTVFFLSNQVSNCLIWILRKVACLFEDLKLPKIVILFTNMVNFCNQDKKFKCFVPTQEVSKIKHKHKKMKFGSISLMSQV